jgi:4-phospho-D-threonate 3-dehydrogenase / 4-phospho-D-erythronate 3-dehydrogenase
MKFQRHKPEKRDKRDKPLLGITMGDPAGIGPEVIAKAMTSRVVRQLCCPLVIGSFPVMERTIKALKL